MKRLGIKVKSVDYTGKTLLDEEIVKAYDFMPKFISGLIDKKIKAPNVINIEKMNDILENCNDEERTKVLECAEKFSILIDRYEYLRVLIKRCKNVEKSEKVAIIKEYEKIYISLKKMYNIRLLDKNELYKIYLNHVYVAKHIKKNNFHIQNTFGKLAYNIGSFMVNFFDPPSAWRLEYTDDRMIKIAEQILIYNELVYSYFKDLKEIPHMLQNGTMRKLLFKSAKKSAYLKGKSIFDKSKWFETLTEGFLKGVSIIRKIFSFAGIAKGFALISECFTKPRKIIKSVLNRLHHFMEKVFLKGAKRKGINFLRGAFGVIDIACNATDFTSELGVDVAGNLGFNCALNSLWTPAIISDMIFSAKDGKYYPKTIEEFVHDNIRFNKSINVIATHEDSEIKAKKRSRR